MIRCPKCDNDTRTSSLVTAQGEVMLAGTIGSDPQPIRRKPARVRLYRAVRALAVWSNPREPGVPRSSPPRWPRLRRRSRRRNRGAVARFVPYQHHHQKPYPKE